MTRSTHSALFRRKKLIRQALVRQKQAWVRARGHGFYCNALSGRSTYNICINADMTVSCNCQDFEGEGVIGDLRQSSLAGVFSGPRASALRARLAAGELPLSICARCEDLRRAPRDVAVHFRSHYTLPKRGIMVENTAGCNLACLTCNRQRLRRSRRRRSLSLADVERVAQEIRGIASVCYFSLGEPFTSPAIAEELRIIREHNPKVAIVTSTNGVLLDSDRKRDAALMMKQIYISLDGVDEEMIRRYQRGADLARTYRNMKALVAYRNARNLTEPLIEWKYLVFNWNDQRRFIDQAIEMAREAGIDRISFWPTLSPLRGVSARYFLGISTPGARLRWKPRAIDLRTGRSRWYSTGFTDLKR